MNFFVRFLTILGLYAGRMAIFACKERKEMMMMAWLIKFFRVEWKYSASIVRGDYTQTVRSHVQAKQLHFFGKISIKHDLHGLTNTCNGIFTLLTQLLAQINVI